jgi:DNA-binding LacI/PurR family transcriptional regulator
LQTFSECADDERDVAAMTSETRHRAATITDVADAAGISISTVSRAFHMPDLVRTSTRARALAAAAELGYTPNRAARGLITGRTGSLGLVVPDIANPFFPPLIKAAQQRAHAGEHSLYLADGEEDPHTEFRAIQMMAKQVDAVVACSSRMSAAQMREAATLVPLVLINRSFEQLPAVVLDMGGGMRQALEHLHGLGHRRCTYLAGPAGSWSSRQRHRAFRLTCSRLAIETVELGPFDPSHEAGVRAADLALAAGSTAIVAFNDLIALGVLSRLAERGVAVPDELSVVGFDDIRMAAMASPPLTTVVAPVAEAGRAAIELALDPLVAVEHSGRRAQTLPTRLRIRASSGPAPAVGHRASAKAGAKAGAA